MNLFNYFKWEKRTDDTCFELCFVLDAGWNTLQEFLPVLVWLKEKHEDVRILTVAIENNFEEMSILEKKLWEALKEYSDAILVQKWLPSRVKLFSRLSLSIHKKIVKKILYRNRDKLLNIQIKNVLFSDDNCQGFKFIYDYFGKTIDGYYIRHDQSSCVGILCVKSNSENLIEDKYATTDWYMYKNLPLALRNIAVVTGGAKLDPWWMNRKKYVVGSSMIDRGSRPCIAIALPKLDDIGRFSQKERDLLLHFMHDNKGYMYLIKFHPRDLQKERALFLRQLKHIDYKLMDVGLDMLAECSDLLIFCGLSSGGADALVYDKPYIEFYDDSIYRSEFYKLQNGKYGTLLHKENCVPHANDDEELNDLVAKYLNKNAWLEYKGRYRKYVIQENAIMNIVSLLKI